MPVVDNINHGLSISVEVVGGLVAVLLLYGLLFARTAPVVFLSVFLSVFTVFVGQVSAGQYLVNHFQCTLSAPPNTTCARDRFQVMLNHVGAALRVEPKAVYLVLMVTMHLVILVGFFRLYTLLLREKGFL